MTLNPQALLKMLLWLAALGAVILVAGKVVGGTAKKAAGAV